MAQFNENLQTIRPSFSFLEIDPNMELLNQFIGLNQQHVMENSNLNMQNLMPFSSDFPERLEENFHHGLVHHEVQVSHHPIFSEENKVHDGKKRKIIDFPAETSSANSTPAVSESGSKIKLVNFLLLFFFLLSYS